MTHLLLHLRDPRGCLRLYKRHPARRLMDQQGGPYVTEPRPSTKSRLAYFHRVELPLDAAAPELEKPAQLGEVRGDVELLPDETLQQVGMIGEMVDDLRGCQPIV